MMIITTIIEQSNRLKELGAPQDTTFSWVKGEGRYWLYLSETMVDVSGKDLLVAAYTLGELIDWLGDDYAALYFMKVGNFHYVAQGTAHKQLDGDKVHKVPVERKGATPLDAIFALVEAVKGGK